MGLVVEGLLWEENCEGGRVGEGVELLFEITVENVKFSGEMKRRRVLGVEEGVHIISGPMDWVEGIAKTPPHFLLLVPSTLLVGMEMVLISPVFTSGVGRRLDICYNTYFSNIRVK